mgnify:CR=1 FL=1
MYKLKEEFINKLNSRGIENTEEIYHLSVEPEFLKLIPEYLHKKNLKKYFRLYFFPNETKIHFNYEKNFYSRQAFINKAISKFKNCKGIQLYSSKSRTQRFYWTL